MFKFIFSLVRVTIINMIVAAAFKKVIESKEFERFKVRAYAKLKEARDEMRKKNKW